MRIVLLYPSWTGSYGVLVRRFARKGSTWPPLNLALLAALAEQRGHEVSILDGQVEGLSHADLVQRALSLKPDLVGFTATSPFFHVTKTVAELLKKADGALPIAVGGPHITIVKEKALFPAFDYLFVGEAEESFPSFLGLSEKGGDLSSVKGLIYRRNGEIVRTTEAPFIPAPGRTNGEDMYPLDRFPFPARHLLPMKRYKLGTLRGNLPFTSIQSLRGCPWKCIFCASEALQTTRVLQRSPRSIIAEIRSVVSLFNIRHFYFVDDVLTLYRERILEICDLLDAEGLKITFEGSTRANLVDEELVGRLARSGLIRLSFGLETVDPEMRRIMKKKVPMQAYLDANRACGKYGVEALNSMMIGLPGETRETVQATLKWLAQARDVKQANFAIAVPYPGTEFHRMAVSKTHGMELRHEDFSKYLRYGTAVTRVGDLSPPDLIGLQNQGFISIYSAPWRWKSMLMKYGPIGASFTVLRVARMIVGKAIRRLRALIAGH